MGDRGRVAKVWKSGDEEGYRKCKPRQVLIVRDSKLEDAHFCSRDQGQRSQGEVGGICVAVK